MKQLKRFLSVLLAFAMVFTSSSFSGINLVNVLAAQTVTANFYLDGSLVGTDTTSAEAGDSISVNSFTKPDGVSSGVDFASADYTYNEVTEEEVTTETTSSASETKEKISRVNGDQYVLTAITGDMVDGTYEFTITYAGVWTGNIITPVLATASDGTTTYELADSTTVSSYSTSDNKITGKVELSNVADYKWFGIYLEAGTNSWSGSDNNLILSLSGSGTVTTTGTTTTEQTGTLEDESSEVVIGESGEDYVINYYYTSIPEDLYEVELANSDFGLNSTYNWNVSVGDTGDSGYMMQDMSDLDDSNVDNEVISIWNNGEDSSEYSISYIIENLEAGTYKLKAKVYGWLVDSDAEDYDSYAGSLTVSGASSSDTATISPEGWDENYDDNWQTVSVVFTVESAGDVTVLLTGAMQQYAWLDFDGFTLYKYDSPVSAKAEEDSGEYEMVYFDSTFYNYDINTYNAAADAAATAEISLDNTTDVSSWDDDEVVTTTVNSSTSTSTVTASGDIGKVYTTGTSTFSGLQINGTLANGDYSVSFTYTGFGWNNNSYAVVLSKDESGSETYTLDDTTTFSYSSTPETYNYSGTLNVDDPSIYKYVGILITSTATSSNGQGGRPGQQSGTTTSTDLGFDDLSKFSFTGTGVTTSDSGSDSDDDETVDTIQPIYMIGSNWVNPGDSISSETVDVDSDGTDETYAVISTDNTTNEDAASKLYPWNYYTGWDVSGDTAVSDTKSVAYTGLASEDLDENGNIQFNYPEGGLFNSDATVKDIYTDVSVPYYINGDYYVLDSALYDVYWPGDGTPSSDSVLEYNFDKKLMGGESIGYLYKGFFPFDGEDDSNANYNFGMNFSVDFTLTSDGTLNGNDMVFDFAGDDDVWVYVDGKLVLDIGGIHDRLTASIDFAKQTAVVNDSEGVATSSESFSEELLEAMNYNSADSVYDENTVHTLSVFYLERGQAESNAYISFNLIPTDTISVEKEVSDALLAELTTELGSETAAKAVEYPFHVEKYNTTTNTWENVLASVDYTLTAANGTVSTATTDENGGFTLKNGDKAEFVVAKVGLVDDDIIRVVEDSTDGVTTSFDTSWEIEDLSSGIETTNSGMASAFKTIDLSEERGIVSAVIENASFNDTVMGSWAATFADDTSVETGVTYDFTDAETSDDNDNEGRNYYYEVANNSDAEVSGSLYRSIIIDNSNTEYTGAYDVSIQVKSSAVGDTGLTLDANGISTSIESYAADSWETYTVSGVYPDENNEIKVTVSGTVAAGVTVGIDDLRIEADTSEDASGSSYEFVCYNTILDVIEYFVELSKSADLVVGEDIDGISNYTVSGISIKSDTEKAGKTYKASLSDSTSSGNADANLTLTYKQTGSTGDYTYTMTYDSDNDGTVDDNVATVVIHVYSTADNVYVLDYGLSTDLADTTYDNGLFENDTLNTGAETKALYDGIKVKDSTDAYTTDAVEGVQGVVTTEASSNSISVDVATNSNAFDGEIIYTPTEFMSEIDEFTYEVKVMKSSVDESAFVENKNGVTMDANLQVMPASVVYYEDNFASSGTDNTDSTKGIIYTTTDGGNIATEGTTSTDKQGNGSGTNYGYDKAYTDDATFSNGSTTVMTAGTSYGTTATFTFKGTGFELSSRTNTTTTTILAEVADSSGKIVKASVVNTFYQSGDLYQIPVMKITGLDYNEYTVTVYVVSTGHQSTFYLDGIRIYDPAGTNTAITDNYIASEVGANYKEVRSLILGEGFYTTRVYADENDTEGTNVLVPGSGVGATLVSVSSDGSTVTTGTGNASMYVESFNHISDSTVTEATTTSDYYEYLMKGPNNETYLVKDNAVAFTIAGYSKRSSSATFQVAAKAVSDSTSMNIFVIDTDGNILTSKSVDVATATELYYEVKLPSTASNGAIVLVENSGSGILSLTGIKYNGIILNTVDTEATEDFASYLTEVTSSVYTVFVKIGVITENSEDSDDVYEDDTEDETTELANTVKAQVSAVSDGKYTLRFIGGIDSINYSAIGFNIAIYDADGNVLKAESRKSVTKVYSSIKANGVSLKPADVYGDDSGINYFYTYTYSNIPASAEYYFSVANVTIGYSDGEKIENVSGYKYYYVTNGTITAVDSIPAAE